MRTTANYFFLIFLVSCQGPINALDTVRTYSGEANAKSVGAGANSELTASLKHLRVAVQSRGTVRVIVGVRAAFAPEGELSAAAVQTQRDGIAAAQAAVLAATPIRRQDSIRRFDTIPFLIMEVDAQELDQLSHQPEVTSIEEDKLSHPAVSPAFP